MDEELPALKKEDLIPYNYTGVVMKSANNLKTFRNASGFAQDRVASFLSIEEGVLADYELGTQETPFPVLIRLSNLYGVDIADFYENNSKKKKDTLICSLRTDDLSEEDMDNIANFKDVVKAYLKMDHISLR